MDRNYIYKMKHLDKDMRKKVAQTQQKLINFSRKLFVIKMYH